MDISEQFIKMSWKARKEIKENWDKFSATQRLGTFICFRSYIGMIIHTKPKKIEGLASVILETYAFRTWRDPGNEDLHIVELGKDFDDKGFPLLRQDQIQGMIGKTELAFCIYQIDDNGDKWGGEVYQDREQIFTIEMDSPEQLWLAFYMYEKHKETWDGEKWVA